MELHQLRYFVRIAETGNFTRAAHDLAVAQPSLSQQVRKLERELGFALFQRGPAGATLTAEGALLLPHARAVLERLDEARTAAAEIRGVRRGVITLGISPVSGAHILPPLLRRVRERFPDLTVRTHEAGIERLLDLLATGEIDLATVLLPTIDDRLVCAPALAEDVVVVLPAGHPLAEREAVDLTELRDEPFVLLTSAYGLRQRITQQCERAGFAPHIAFESGEVTIIQGLVEAGLGLTILPESAVRRDVATVARALTVGGLRQQRRVGLAMRVDRYVPLAARAVFDLARELFTPADDHHSGANSPLLP